GGRRRELPGERAGRGEEDQIHAGKRLRGGFLDGDALPPEGDGGTGTPAARQGQQLADREVAGLQQGEELLADGAGGADHSDVLHADPSFPRIPVPVRQGPARPGYASFGPRSSGCTCLPSIAARMVGTR